MYRRTASPPPPHPETFPVAPVFEFVGASTAGYVVVGSPTLTQDHCGVAAAAVVFDGASYLTYNGSTTTLPSGNAPKTTTLWLTCAATVRGQSVFQFAASAGAGAAIQAQRFSTFLFLGGAAAPLSFVGQSDDCSTAFNVCDGAWHHVAMSYAAPTVSVYVDGAFVSSCVIAPLSIPASPKVFVAWNGNLAWGTSLGEIFQGSLSHARIFNVALSAAQVAADAQTGCSATAAVSKPVSWSAPCPAIGTWGALCGCPPGTYSASTALASAAECTPCDAGSYCLGATAAPSGACPAGYFCPEGTSAAQQFPCPAGTFSSSMSLSAASQCSACGLGNFCVAASTAPTPCPATTYSNSSTTPANSSCLACPAGYRCAQGTGNHVACSPGTYSPPAAASCAVCPRGSFCPINATTAAQVASTFLCPAGLWCDAGLVDEPDYTAHTCWPGSFCPQGTAYPQPCPAGTYSPFAGLSSVQGCLWCPAGSYCLANSTAPTALCPTAHFCPNATGVPTAFPCPSKTYRDTPGATSQADCALCPSGAYCLAATTHPAACPPGSFCPTNSDAPTACAIGTYSNVTGVKRVEDCEACTPGSYCGITGLIAPQGLCDPGYYCYSGSNTSGACWEGGGEEAAESAVDS